MSRHAAEQLQKRYGKAVNQHKLLEEIRQDRYIVRRHSANPDTWIYDVAFEGDVLRLVVDKNLTEIITALPPAFTTQKQKQGEKRVRKNVPPVDEVEEAFDLAAESQAEEKAIGVQLEEAKEAEAFWRKSLINALLKIQQLEAQIDERKKIEFFMQK
jgi:hypothetical protein